MNPARKRIRALTIAALAGSFLLAALVGPAAAGTRSDNVVHRFADGQPVAGSAATLVTSLSGATLSLRTAELDAGAYTTWWVPRQGRHSSSH